MLRLILTCFLVLSLFQLKAGTNDSTLSVLTYNINYGAFSSKSVTALRSFDADVVCLQETNEAWEKVLRSVCKEYPYIVFRNRGAAGGQAILSKYPIADTTFLTTTHGWFEAGIYTVTTPKGNVQLLNVHLKPPISEKGRIGFLGSAFFKSKKIRKREIEQHYKSINSSLPLIVTGDFNENDKGKAIKWLRKQHLTDALPLFDKKSHTWHWKTRFIHLKGRYDKVVFSKHFTCKGAQVKHQGQSDHYPVFGKLHWNK
jgi:endonuclease/exonuclease/phosphatase family metal-dependent hydrolase